MATLADVRLEIRSDPCLLAVARSVIREWLVTARAPDERREEIVLAIDEACSNAIRHSYRGYADGIVEVRLRSTPEALVVEVLDSGQPCPSERVQPQLLKPPSSEQLKPGGLGVQLMHQVFDEVRFSLRPEGGNHVTMRLHRQKRG